MSYAIDWKAKVVICHPDGTWEDKIYNANTIFPAQTYAELRREIEAWVEKKTKIEFPEAEYVFVMKIYR